MASREEDGLDVVRWRFVEPKVEAAYHAWRMENAVRFNRAGLFASIGNWVTVTPLLLAFGVHGARAFAVAACGVVLPVIIAGLFTTYRRSLLHWMFPLTALANAVAGIVAVGYLYWLLRSGDTTPTLESVVVAQLIVNFFGFGILRLPPFQSIVAVLPYTLLCAWLVVRELLDQRIPLARCALDEFTIASGFFSGVVVCFAIDLSSRFSFRQERIIEAQKETIARERAKSEGLLKQELSHQVAERSRELGTALARGQTIASSRLVEGERFATRYNVVRALGEGGMGAVYEVERVTDGTRLALKIVTGEVSAVNAARFAREAEIGARIHHPNLVSIVDVGISDAGAPYLVMELVEGGSLEDHREQFGRNEWAIPILRQIAQGLAALHHAGVVHRDLKPANVLLSGDVARISDFGISRLGEVADPAAATINADVHGLTKTNAMLGTPLYMAPECARGGKAVSIAADVFAFGIVAYEMLTGKSPFAMPPVMLALAQQSIPTPHPLDRAIPAPLRKTILDCLRTNPAERPHVRDVVDVLIAESASIKPVGTHAVD